MDSEKYNIWIYAKSVEVLNFIFLSEDGRVNSYVGVAILGNGIMI